jgi:hypothetical protein
MADRVSGRNHCMEIMQEDFVALRPALHSIACLFDDAGDGSIAGCSDPHHDASARGTLRGRRGHRNRDVQKVESWEPRRYCW